MSDDAYAAFLEKANQDPSKGYAPPAATTSSSTVSAATKNAPPALVAAVDKVFYTSDSDEPFSAVALPLQGGSLPDEDTFVRLAMGSTPVAEVSILDPFEWDPQGRYTELLDAVRAAGQGNDVRVYRVQLAEGARVEYWLVTVDDADGKSPQLVGVKALSIES